MCTTKRSHVRFVVLVTLPLLICLYGCTRSTGKGATNASKTFSDFDAKRELSGIWYHTPSVKMQKPKERNFSWGVSTFDYWNALCIDLLNDQQLVGFADGGWDRVTIEIDKEMGNVVYVHMGQSISPGKEEARIQIESEGIMTFTFVGGEDTAYTKMVNGKFYKVVDPRKLAPQGAP